MFIHLNRRNRLHVLFLLLALLLIVCFGWPNSPSFVATSPGQASAGVADGSHSPALPAGPNVQDRGSYSKAPAGAAKSSGPIVSYDVKHDLSPPLSSMKPLPVIQRPNRDHELDHRMSRAPQSNVKDPVVQNWFGPLAMPTPIVNFAGISFTGSSPPDTNGDVGPNHYVQWVNTSFEIFNKSG